jgi:hypothetical protein
MQQLALFDIDSAVAPSLKPGDWVKLRRKSTSAAYWKKGEVIQIESVHPVNGSARFWNDRTESWGYLHPGDVISVPPPLDSVSTAPPADTESIPDPVCLDSVSGPVATYRPKGTARGGEYFRFSYRAGGKMKHLHIPGGNTGSVLAQSRAAEVMELAAAGVPSLEICDRIKSWSKKNHLETE